MYIVYEGIIQLFTVTYMLACISLNQEIQKLRCGRSKSDEKHRKAKIRTL